MSGNLVQNTPGTVRFLNKEVIEARLLIDGEALPSKCEIDPGTNHAIRHELRDLHAAQQLQMAEQIVPQLHLRQRRNM